MPEPLSIAVGAVSLTAGVSNLLMRIGLFVSEVRAARKDMDAVARELTSLQLCLETLRDDEQQRQVAYPDGMKKTVYNILVNIELVFDEMRHILSKLSSGRLSKKIQWALSEQQEMNRLRDSLESNKNALEIVLSVGTISILTKQHKTTDLQDQKLSQIMQQNEEIAATTRGVTDKLNVLTLIQRDTSKIDVIGTELSSLRAQIQQLSLSFGGGGSWSALIEQSQFWSQSLVEPYAPLRNMVADINKSDIASPCWPQIANRERTISRPYMSDEVDAMRKRIQDLQAELVCVKAAKADELNHVHQYYDILIGAKNEALEQRESEVATHLQSVKERNGDLVSLRSQLEASQQELGRCKQAMDVKQQELNDRNRVITREFWTNSNSGRPRISSTNPWTDKNPSLVVITEPRKLARPPPRSPQTFEEMGMPPPDLFGNSAKDNSDPHGYSRRDGIGITSNFFNSPAR